MRQTIPSRGFVMGKKLFVLTAFASQLVFADTVLARQSAVVLEEIVVTAPKAGGNARRCGHCGGCDQRRPAARGRRAVLDRSGKILPGPQRANPLRRVRLPADRDTRREHRRIHRNAAAVHGRVRRRRLCFATAHAGVSLARSGTHGSAEGAPRNHIRAQHHRRGD